MSDHNDWCSIILFLPEECTVGSSFEVVDDVLPGDGDQGKLEIGEHESCSPYQRVIFAVLDHALLPIVQLVWRDNIQRVIHFSHVVRVRELPNDVPKDYRGQR